MNTPVGRPRAQARIDLAALRSNVEVLRSAAPTAQLMAVVKADAYGHGLVECSRAAVAAGASYLGVALPEEAIELRANGVDAAILAWLLQTDSPAQWIELVERDVDVSVSSLKGLECARIAAAESGTSAKIHLKLDTGMARGGSGIAEWALLLDEVSNAVSENSIEVIGMWTHLAFADQPAHPVVEHQLELFAEGVAQAKRQGITPLLRHVANSAATFRTPSAHFDLVRPGISIYGLSPGSAVGTAEELGLQPVMRLSGAVTQVKPVEAGQGVSYGHDYVTQRDTTIALVPMGYADGIPTGATNVGPVVIAGEHHVVAGRVCMDQIMIDVGDADVHEGDEVVFFGSGATGEPSADDWAQVTGTIGYEIVTRIGVRVPRVFAGGSA